LRAIAGSRSEIKLCEKWLVLAHFAMGDALSFKHNWITVYTSLTVGYSVWMDDDLIKSRIDATYAEMERMLSTSLYGDDPDIEPPTRWQRLKYYVLARLRRIHDAWLVLTGRADIGY
jgi:hypothetical protein